MQEFSGLLLPYLEQGNKIEIIVEGYASPLASGDYNKRLTKRRISSVINQLSVWSNGALSDYLARGILIVKEDPIRSFIEKHKDVKPSGAIAKWVDCLTLKIEQPI